MPTIPERVEAPIFTITNRINAFTVLGLIFMRWAISLLVKPSRRNCTVSCSRAVSPKRSETSAIVVDSWLFLSIITIVNFPD